MRKLLPALLCATALVATSLPAQAGGGYYHGKYYGYYGKHYGYKSHKRFKRHHYAHRHHRHYHHRHRHHHRRGGIGDEILLGAGIIGGSIIVGSLLSQPRRAAPPPPPVYYAPPPQPYCVQDQVYRYLPDGSVQWGIRTRCY